MPDQSALVRSERLMNIGDWVRRKGGKWHIIESLIVDRVVTRCGRQMEEFSWSRGKLEVSEVKPLTRMIDQPQLCKGGCDR